MKPSRGFSLHFILLLLFYFFALLPIFFFLSNTFQPDVILQLSREGVVSTTGSEQLVALYQQLQSRQDSLLLWFGIYVLVVSGLIIVIARQITRPLRDLERQATTMAQGNLGSAIRAGGSLIPLREAHHVAAALESARVKILQSYQELESQVAERTWDLQVKVHQLSQAEQRIQASNKALAESLAVNQRQRVVLQDVLDNMPVGVMISRAANGPVEFINRRAGELLDGNKRGGDYAERYQIYQVDQKTLYDASQLPINASFGSKKGSYKEDLFARRPDGNFIQLYAQSSVLYDKIGQVELTIMIFDDITARKEIERQKSEFVSVASHQLRTPLTGVKWFAELLLDKRSGKLSEKQRSFADNILQSTERLISLVNDLLNVSRIESHRVAITPEPVDIKKLLENLQLQLTPLWTARQQTVKLESPERVPLISLDPKFIAEAFTNLLSNAIKYSPDGSIIHIAIELRPSDVLITVSDRGLGIPMADQSKLFTKFFRADNVVKKETEGTGLGLYVTKRIIEASGGTISFQSAENKGTQFFITLPLTGSPMIKGEKQLI